jgi:hypothetical protein
VPDLEHLAPLPCCHRSSPLPDPQLKGAGPNWPDSVPPAKVPEGKGHPRAPKINEEGPQKPLKPLPSRPDKPEKKEEAEEETILGPEKVRLPVRKEEVSAVGGEVLAPEQLPAGPAEKTPEKK